MVIHIQSNRAVATGTYSSAPTSMQIVNGCSPSLEYDAPKNATYANIAAATSNAVVNITAISSVGVQGSFSGTLNLYPASGACNNVTITDGKFSAAFK